MEQVPQGAGALVALFEERKELRFPDLDAEVLRSSLAEIDEALEAVRGLEEKLEQARGRLALRQEAFLAKAHRALAYARVFAEEDPALADRLSLVILPRGRKPVVARAEPLPLEAASEAPKARRRRAPRAESEALFAQAEPTAPA